MLAEFCKNSPNFAQSPKTCPLPTRRAAPRNISKILHAPTMRSFSWQPRSACGRSPAPRTPTPRPSTSATQVRGRLLRERSPSVARIWLRYNRERALQSLPDRHVRGLMYACAGERAGGTRSESRASFRSWSSRRSCLRDCRCDSISASSARSRSREIGNSFLHSRKNVEDFWLKF